MKVFNATEAAEMAKKAIDSLESERIDKEIIRLLGSRVPRAAKQGFFSVKINEYYATNSTFVNKVEQEGFRVSWNNVANKDCSDTKIEYHLSWGDRWTASEAL